MPGFGSAGSLRVKAEASAGAAPSSGYFVVPVTGFDLIPKLGNRVTSKVLGSSYPAVNAAFRSPIGTQGTVSAEGDYNGSLDWLLYGILGAKATTGDGTTDPRTNTYTPSATPPTFHLEYIAGNVPSGKCYRFQNVLVQELAINGDANGLIEARANLVAEKEASATGGDTPTTTGLVTPTGVPINAAPQMTKWNLGVGSDTTYCLRKFALNARRPLAPPRACFGSTFYKAPSFLGPLEVDYEFEIEWDNESIYRAFVAATALTAIDLKWVGAALLTGNYTLELRVNRSDLDEAGPPAWRDNGVLVSTVKGTAYGNAGSTTATEPMTAQTINLINGAVI